MQVYPVGTEVLISDEVSATIVTVAIHSGNYVQYECAWWSGGSRTREWFHETEIQIDKKDKTLKIGFSQ